MSFNMLPRTVAHMRIYKRRCNWRGAPCNLVRAESARGYSHFARRGGIKHGHDIVSIYVAQNELQHNIAHYCTYVYLQAVAQLTQSTVQFNARGNRARRIASRMARR